MSAWCQKHPNVRISPDCVACALEEALGPLVAIADAYDRNGLDDARPEWGEPKYRPVELYCGRGGKRLLTLEDCFRARQAVRGTAPSLEPLKAIESMPVEEAVRYVLRRHGSDGMSAETLVEMFDRSVHPKVGLVLRDLAAEGRVRVHRDRSHDGTELRLRYELVDDG